MTLTDKLERFFRENPNVFIDGKDLAAIAGSYAWRTRLSDVRRRFRAIPGTPDDPLPNRQTVFRVGDKIFKRSEYMAILPSRDAR